MSIPQKIESLEQISYVESTVTSGQPVKTVGNADGTPIGTGSTTGNVADDAADSGNPVKIGGRAVDPTSLPTAVSANDRVDIITDLSRRTIVTLGTLISGEDQTAGVMKVEQRFSGTYISTATTTTVKSGAGFLNSITITETAAGAITVYDNTAGSGTILAAFKASIVEGTYHLNISFATGLTIVTAGASKLTVSLR